MWPPGATMPAAQLLAGGRLAAGLRGGLAAGGEWPTRLCICGGQAAVFHAGQAATAAGGSTWQLHRSHAAAGAHLVGRSARRLLLSCGGGGRGQAGGAGTGRAACPQQGNPTACLAACRHAARGWAACRCAIGCAVAGGVACWWGVLGGGEEAAIGCAGLMGPLSQSPLRRC